MNSIPNPMGLAAGFLFLGAIVWLLRWLAAPPPAALPATSGNPTRPDSNCILVPLMELETVRSAVELACQLASERRARVLLVHVIELPYTVDLNVAFPEGEEQARNLLAMGESIVKQHDLPAESRVLRHRTTEQAVSELAREIGAHTIVMSTRTLRWWSLGRLDHIMADIMRNAPCRVVVAGQPLPV